MLLNELQKELQQEKDKIGKIWKDSEKRIEDLKTQLSKEKGSRYDYFRFTYKNVAEHNAQLVDCPQCNKEGKLPLYSLKATLENIQEYTKCPLCKGNGKCYFVWGYDNDSRDWKHDAVC